MKPDQALTIYEIRALDQAALRLFDHPEPRRLLGPTLAGLHWEADFAFVFFAGEPGREADEFLARNPNLARREVHRLRYDQWQDGAGAEPFTVAGLTVAPPGGQAAGPDRVVIDPGLAFGFGGHPTTRACLEFLARASRDAKARAGALDLGAGTGILSLAAARLGVEKVLGVDYSHLAVEAANHNLSLNGLAGRVEFARGPAQDHARRTAPILLANLHLSLQEELFELGAFQGRRLAVVSGLLPGEGERLFEKLRSVPLKLVDQIRTDRWITMLLEGAGLAEP